MRILIVDDEPLARVRLRQLLSTCEDVEVIGCVGDAEAAMRAIESAAPDVLLLDINMPGPSGMTLTAQLAGRTRPQVVFCTAYEYHALKAFELGAADYLMKPVQPDRLHEALQRAHLRLTADLREPTGFLYARVRGVQVRLPMVDVIYLLAEDKFVVVHHSHGDLLLDDSLRQLEETYPGQLVRLHRRCLVPNKRLLGLETLPDGRVLAKLANSKFMPEVSRRCLPAVRKVLRMA